MGLANKLGTAGASPAGASAPSAPPMSAGGFPGQTPPGYPQIGGQGRPGQASPYVSPANSQHSLGASSQSNLYGSTPPGQYGAPGSQQPGYGQPGYGQPGYGQPNSQQPGQYGAASSQGGSTLYPQMGGQGPQGGRPQQSGFPGQSGIPGQYGAQQNQYGGQQGQYGAPQGQYGNPQGQYGTPQGQYGQPSQPSQFGGQQGFGGPGQQQIGGPGSGGGVFSQPMVMQKLQKLVQENRLQAFYPPQKLQQVAAYVAGRDVEGLGQRWRLPREVTMDLVGLALYDICIYVDDSGSMAFEEGGERIDDMKAVLGRTADAATLFDTDGIVVRFMNSNVEGNGIHSEAEAAALIQQIRFSGTTPLGTSLDRKVLQPMVLSQARSNSMQKPVLVIAITDGEPTGEPKDTTRQVVINAKNLLSQTQYGPGAVAFQFAQVGKDAAATRFLESLDTDPVCGNMIDSTSYFEQEQEQYLRKGINLDPALYLAKLMLGGIDRSYDEADEG